MSLMPDPLGAEPVAAGLIRANLTGDEFTTDRILTRAFEADLDGLFFAFMVANLAGRILAQACGSEAQAVALVDSWINELVRYRARAAALQLDLRSVPGSGLLFSLELDLGFPLDPCGVFAAGLPFGLLGRDALCGLVGPHEQLIQPRRAVIVPGLRRYGLTFRAGLWSGRGIRPERGWRVWLGCAPRRPGFPGVDGGLVLAGDGTFNGLEIRFELATVQSSSEVHRWAVLADLFPARAARVVGVRLWLSRLFPWCRGCRRPISRIGR